VWGEGKGVDYFKALPIIIYNTPSASPDGTGFASGVHCVHDPQTAPF